ncbi:hypothetical protein M0802_007842 [Mischocyttarus mexicanus]|nr:hypothetical protein M0802_007842 [Mischocyttarus mexicanus]
MLKASTTCRFNKPWEDEYKRKARIAYGLPGNVGFVADEEEETSCRIEYSILQYSLTLQYPFCVKEKRNGKKIEKTRRVGGWGRKKQADSKREARLSYVATGQNGSCRTCSRSCSRNGGDNDDEGIPLAPAKARMHYKWIDESAFSGCCYNEPRSWVCHIGRPSIKSISLSAFRLVTWRVKIMLLLACVLICNAQSTEEDQTGRSRVSEDQLNMALSDQRYLRRQLKCALGEAPCDPVGRRLKSLAPLVLRGSCPQCTPEETHQIKKVLSHIQRSFPKEWSKVVQQYAGVS